MSNTLTIANRQRRVSVDLDEIRQMCETLKAAVFANLIAAPVDWLNSALLVDMSVRGVFSLVLVSNRQIKTLNKDWRGKDSPTDVLSFPLELEPPPLVELPWEVGEVIISLEKASEQAQEYGHPLRRELAFLFVHGTLHVLGFDHIEPLAGKEMFARQKAILDSAGYQR